jgi:hypothetical protein
MKQNLGSVDQALRLIVGLALVLLAISGTIGVWGWIGIVPLATAVLNYCPLYHVLGIDSHGHKSRIAR